MNAGQLDERITIKTMYSSSIDLHGGVVNYYTTASVWCDAKSENGDGGVSNGMDRVVSRYTFTVRHNPAIKESSEIVYNGYNYDIRYIESPFGRNQWHIIHAERTIGGD